MNKILNALLAFSFTAAASADAYQYRFAYSAADFADLASVEQLHKRIARTARDFCPAYLPAKHLAETRRCMAEVTRDIVQSIDHPALTAITEGAVDDARIALEEHHKKQARASKRI